MYKCVCRGCHWTRVTSYGAIRKGKYDTVISTVISTAYIIFTCAPKLFEQSTLYRSVKRRKEKYLLTEQLIEEWRGMKKIVTVNESSDAVSVVRKFCSHPGHMRRFSRSTQQIPTVVCRLCVTPDGLREISFRLSLTATIHLMTLMRTKPQVRQNDARTKKESAECTAMLRSTPSLDLMLVESRTASYMAVLGEHVGNKQNVTTDIRLADDSTVTAIKMGVGKVVWHNKSGTTTVRLSETPVVRNIKKRLLSVPALGNKDIAVLFVPGKALVIVMLNRETVIGYSCSVRKVCSTSPTVKIAVPVDISDDEDTVRAMMATVGSAINIDKD